LNPYKIRFELELGKNQELSISIQKTEEISQYIENLHELLLETFPDVNLQNSGDNVKLKSENGSQLLSTFEALLEALCNVDIKS
jgi:hypothetical protein